MPPKPKLKALLIDLNGTLHVGSQLTPRAAGAVERLRKGGIPFVFWTVDNSRVRQDTQLDVFFPRPSNSTKESESLLITRLNKMGLPSARDELITSLGACRSLVESRGLRPFLLLSPEAAEEFAGIDTRPPHNAVVLGLYPAGFDYEHLNTAFRILKREPLCDGETDTAASATDVPSAPVLIAPHKAAYHQAPASSAFPAGLSLGIGAYVRALEDAAGVTAEVVGKPTASFYALAMARMEAKYGIKVDAADVAIVGDDVNNDLGAGAVELGLKRILVRTGKYRAGAEDAMEVPPDHVYDTFADLVDELLA